MATRPIPEPDSMPAPDPDPARRNRPAAAVRARIIDAAAQLFAQRTPSSVTLREIAAVAGVQHSLIIRHFGSKAGLVEAVVATTASGYAESVARGADAADGFVQALHHLLANPVATAAFAAAQLGHEVAPAGQGSYPGASLHRRLLEDAAGPESRDPRVVAAFGLCAVAGWAMLEDWARVAFDLESMPLDDLRAEVDRMLRELIVRNADLGRQRATPVREVRPPTVA